MLSILKCLRAAGRDGIKLEFGRRRSAKVMSLRYGLVDMHESKGDSTIFTINKAGLDLITTEKAIA